MITPQRTSPPYVAIPFSIVMFVIPLTYNFVPKDVQAVYILLLGTGTALVATYMLWSGSQNVIRLWREDRNTRGQEIARPMKYMAPRTVFVLAGMHMHYLLDTK